MSEREFLSRIKIWMIWQLVKRFYDSRDIMDKLKGEMNSESSKNVRNKISLRRAIKPFLKDIEDSLSLKDPFPTLYIEGIRFRLKRLDSFLDRVQEKYGFEIDGDFSK